MSVEQPYSPENPRTGISFWSEENRDFLTKADPIKISNLLQIQPSVWVPVLHELWRIGRENTAFELLKEDKGVRAFICLQTGEFVDSLTVLHASKNETYNNCLQFLKETIYMIDNARSEKELGKIEDWKKTILDSEAEFLMSLVKKNRDTYYGTAGFLN